MTMITAHESSKAYTMDGLSHQDEDGKREESVEDVREDGANCVYQHR